MNVVSVYFYKWASEFGTFCTCAVVVKGNKPEAKDCIIFEQMTVTSFVAFEMLKCPTELFRSLRIRERVSNTVNMKQGGDDEDHLCSECAPWMMGEKHLFDLFQHY